MVRVRRLSAPIALLLLAAGLLAGCGFHLRGAVELPEVLQSTYLQGVSPDSALAEQVRAVLEGSGGEVVNRLADASAILQLGGDRVSRRIASVNPNGKVREYALHYVLTYSLLNPAGDVLLPGRTVETTRIYTFDQSNVLGMATEEAVLTREMRGFAVAQMMRQVQLAAGEGLEPVAEAGAGKPAAKPKTADDKP